MGGGSTGVGRNNTRRIAHAVSRQSVDENQVGGIKGAISTSKDTKVNSTCLFLPSDKLYLIPFYDLALLRGTGGKKKGKNVVNKRVAQMRKDCQTKYKDNIRNLTKLMQGK